MVRGGAVGAPDRCVCAQRRGARTLAGARDRFDLDMRAPSGSAATAKVERAGGGGVPHARAVDRVDGGEIVHVDEEDRRLDDRIQRKAGGLQHGREIVEHLRGLAGDAALDEFAGCRIEPDLSAAEDEAAGGADGLTVRPPRARVRRVVSRAVASVIPGASARVRARHAAKAKRRRARKRDCVNEDFVRVGAWIEDYLRDTRRYPVLSRAQPGDLIDALPAAPPDQPESFETIFRDFEALVMPGITHWNHPRFFAYFSISAGTGDDSRRSAGRRT